MLTDYCNLNCIHCYLRPGDHEPRRKELNTEQVCNVIRQMREAGVMYLLLSGGEPLLRPDFKEIYLFAKKNNFATVISSNGTLLTKDMVSFLRKHPPMVFDISVYGITQNTYESITRVPGSFAKFQNALSMLKGSGIRTFLKFISMKKNYKEAAELELFAERMGMPFQCSYFLWLRLDGDKSKNALIKRQRLDANETVELFDMIGEDPRSFFHATLECGSVEACGAASIGCVVDSQGRLKPCSFLVDNMSSLKGNNFKEAWSSIALGRAPVQKKMTACENCRHTAYCKWCPGASYLETRNSGKKITYLCKLMDDLARMKVVGAT